MDTLVEKEEQITSIINCPDCQSDIPVHDGYITWCECGYNLHPKKEEKKESKIDRIYARLGEKRGQAILNMMMTDTRMVKHITWVKGFALVLATIVHITSLVSLLFGIYLISHSGHYIMMFLGLVLIGIAWFTRPKVGKIEDHERIIPRDESPATYNVIDQLAALMGLKKIDGIILNEEYNASITKIGWRRKTIVRIGVPFFSALTIEEQCSILAHELGHYLNKDLTYGFYLGTALNTLIEWYSLLDPVRPEETFEYSIIEMISSLFMKILALVPYVLIYILIHLIWNESQINEYWADYRQAQICGSTTAVKALEKLNYHRIYFHKVSKASVNDRAMGNIIDEFRNALSVLPQREIKRIKLQSSIEKSKLDNTHPPTTFRIQFLEKQVLKTVFSIEPFLSKKMEEELDSYKQQVHDAAVENYRYYFLS